MIVTITFMPKISLKFFSKTFAIQFFFTDNLNQKTVNKTTCRTPSENTRQLWVHFLKSFPTVAITFDAFRIS